MQAHAWRCLLDTSMMLASPDATMCILRRDQKRESPLLRLCEIFFLGKNFSYRMVGGIGPSEAKGDKPHLRQQLLHSGRHRLDQQPPATATHPYGLHSIPLHAYVQRVKLLLHPARSAIPLPCMALQCNGKAGPGLDPQRHKTSSVCQLPCSHGSGNCHRIRSSLRSRYRAKHLFR